MAETPVESVLEGKRREAVRAIAQAGARAQRAADTGRGLARAGQQALGPSFAAEREYNVPGLAEELNQLIRPVIEGNDRWMANSAGFETGQTTGMQDAAGRFFSGVQSAVPIVRAEADAARAGVEAGALNALLQAELGVGQSGFNFRQALEARTRARESQDFERQAHTEDMALAAERLEFEREKLRQLQAKVAPPTSEDVFNDVWTRRFGRPLTRG